MDSELYESTPGRNCNQNIEAWRISDSAIVWNVLSPYCFYHVNALHATLVPNSGGISPISLDVIVLGSYCVVLQIRHIKPC